MEAAKLCLSVPISSPDKDEPTVYELELPGLRNCTLAKVAGSALADMQQLLDGLKTGSYKADTLLERLRQIAGPKSALLQQVSAIFAPAAQVAKATNAKSGNPPDAVDAIFAKVEKAPDSRSAKGEATTAVSAFVTAGRTSSKGDQKTPARLFKKAGYAIEEAMLGIAAAILASPAVATIESNWRGLKFLVDQCPSKTQMRVDCVDAVGDSVTEAIRTLRESEWGDLPDAIFVAAPVASMETIRELADLGEELQVPLVLSASPGLFGAESAQGVLDGLESPYGGLGPSWQELLAEEPTRWLSLAVNQVVLYGEGAGTARRSVLGSPVFAIAALLASSCKDTGDCSRIFGKPGSLSAPGSRILSGGRHDGVSVPTEAFYSAATQSKLATLGIVGLGSGRNTDSLSLNCAPTVRSCQSALSLPGQILTGKIVRFAQWAREQVPAGANNDEICTLFKEAAHVFLFRGATEGITFQVDVQSKAEARTINIGVQINQSSGNGFQVAFGLPL